MPNISAKTRLAVLIVSGMMVLMAGVVAGSAVGTLIRPQPSAGPGSDPLLLGKQNHSGTSRTRLFGDTDGAALWVTQNGSGAAIRGDNRLGRAAVFVSGHRSAEGVLAQNEALVVGDGAAVRAEGNKNAGLRATSDSVAIAAVGQGLALYADGSTVVTGDLSIQGDCTGCVTAALAINRSTVALERGDAVTVTGSTTDADGAVILEVKRADLANPGLGVMSSAVEQASVPLGIDSSVTTYAPKGGPALAGQMLRVAVGGIIDYAKVDASGGDIQVGMSLEPSATAGVLTAAPIDSVGLSIGYALSPIANGYVTVLLSPH